MNSSVSAERLHKALDQATRLIEQHERAKRDPVAIIGMSCRFPGGADSPAAFWRMLAERRDGLSEVPSDRWSLERFYSSSAKAPGRMYSKYGGFVGGIDQFDPEFFGLSQREAERMDPQQRLLLELVWNALENAAEIPAQLKGKSVGVFVGLCYHDYADIQVMRGTDMEIDVHTGTGVAASIASGRLSHFLGVHGPSLTVDTACSSSLLAVHLACQSLRAGECDMAIVGGVQVIISPLNTIGLCRIGALGTHRSCRTFDRDANGMVRGEGAGVIVLKRMSEALRDANPIHAHIRGTATNHDGESSGLTVPNGSAQAKVIRTAHLQGGTHLRDIVYLEAHGTGTPLGDPIEVRGIAQAFAGSDCSGPIYLGSVKSSIGHLEAASGIASLIKAVEILKHGQVPPQAHFEHLNPLLQLPDSPRLIVPTALENLPKRDAPLLAGVSSFGFSGANVHVVLEQAPKTATEETGDHRPLLLALSGRCKDTLIEAAREVLQCMEGAKPQTVRALCAWSLLRRTHFEHRIAIFAADKSEILARLQAVANARFPSEHVFYGQRKSKRPELIFHFTGASLLEFGELSLLRLISDKSAAVISECETVLKAEKRSDLLNARDPSPAKQAVLAYIQQCSFFELWREWEVSADQVTFESTGRFAADWAAGRYTLEHGLRSLLASLSGYKSAGDIHPPPSTSAFVVRLGIGTSALQHPKGDYVDGYLTAQGLSSVYCAAARLFSMGWIPRCGRSDWINHCNQPLETPAFAFQRRKCWLPPTAVYSLSDQAPNFEALASRFVREVKRGAFLDPVGVAKLESVLTELRSPRTSSEESYEVRWDTAPCRVTNRNESSQRVWLLFCADCADSDLVTNLRDNGDSVLVVRWGFHFAQDGDQITIREDHVADYVATLARAREYGGSLHVVYIATPSGAPEDLSIKSAETACRKFLHLYQALMDVAGSAVSLWCLTPNAVQAIATQECAREASLHLAPLLGMARAVALESPLLWGGLIDHDGSANLADVLQAEARDRSEDIIVYRRGVRYVSRLARAESDRAQSQIECSPSKCYLVTGGAGAIGFRFAQWLIERGARRLVLMSRGGSAGALSNRLAKLREFGAEILHIKGDVGVRADVQSAMQTISQHNWVLGGIVHAAGIAGYQISASLQWSQFSKVLSPKIRGAVFLHEATLNSSLEFYIMVSSVASVWGSQNQIHYAAANSFLDQLAHFRHSAGLPATTVNLGPWSEGGMTPAEGLRQLEEIGVGAVSPDDLFRKIDGLLRHRTPQAIIANMSWPVFAKVMNARRQRTLLSAFSEAKAAPDGRTANISCVSVDLPAVEEIVRKTLATVMNSPSSEFSTGKSFFELGLDSIMAVEFKDALAAKFGITLSATLVFNFPTIRDVAAYILANTSEHLAQNSTSAPAAAPGDQSGELEAEITRLENAL